MLTTTAMTGFKNYVKKTVSYAKYKVGSTYYRTELTDIYIDDDDCVSIDFVIDSTLTGSITVTEIQLYDTGGNLWLSKSESITRKSTQEGIFYRFVIDISEV